ncbi:MFS transporter [Kushneria phyllosphaerae]|uniref:Inner membrane metabolite transport protein YhjE n=1 Tax=Kushneria phyllosphaerae TaxID=2100822 RepID=A0A2R8CLH9_9GAMM|nr:MFS transporter [Kushneria phyllosphaerae]SPJ33760.1 Inner membrane metabolite transport protein YhjE [Kushneria phyllosphaerae]
MTTDTVSSAAGVDTPRRAPANTPRRVMIASLAGTTIEFYDFYIFATAAALVIGPTFFPGESSQMQVLAAFMSFGLAFVARPVGSLLFGHFGDRIGRKSTLVASLVLMGGATVGIGLLPGYESIGIGAPILLCVFRLCQGLGIGGEWGGAALLATENAPRGRRAFFGMFPQLGPSLGFLLANGVFLVILLSISDEAFMAWGWRIPFLLSAVLVVIGLYVRTTLVESEVFNREQQKPPGRAPMIELLRDHRAPLLQGTLAMVACYAIFYITTVFTLNYATQTQGIDRGTFLGMLCFAIIFMAVATPLSALACDRFGRKPVIISGLVFTMLVGLLLAPLISSASTPLTLLFLCLGLTAMGWIYAPMGALLPELLPTRVRYSGAGVAYSLAGILGASLAPYAAQWLVGQGGLSWVGYYIVGMAMLSLVAMLTVRETRDNTL